MRLKRLELSGFKSFAKKTTFLFEVPITAIVGPNGSGKSNAAEAFRWVLGERSLKSLRGQRGEDLIFNGANTGVRASRAAVSLVFDNADHYFSLDYDEVALTREVYRDGTNIYSINGTPVRYRDLVEFLAQASLGAPDHYIINQGEADRVLLANPPERRSLVEDALGLRLYQWKITESEKKLEQTKDNLEKVASLRREIAPHLRFLKKQMERIEQADQLRRELKQLYLEYFKREEIYLQNEKSLLAQERREPEVERQETDDKLREKTDLAETESEAKSRAAREKLEDNLRQLAIEREKLNRQLGRLEGMIEIRRESTVKSKSADESNFTFTEVSGLVKQINDELDGMTQLADIYSVRGVLARLKEMLRLFLRRKRAEGQKAEAVAELNKLERERELIVVKVSELATEEKRQLAEKVKLEQELIENLEAVRAAEREVFVLKSRRQELSAILSGLESRAARLAIEETNFRRELAEAKTLVDQEVMLYKNFVIVIHGEPEKREEQEKRRHQLERLKIKLEDLGVESDNTIKEHREVTERDAFLAKEITDLERAEATLRMVIKDLAEKIDQEFHEGLKKINRHFQDFFILMFGGGAAHLSVTKTTIETEEETEEAGGLEINVNLPRKKIRGLEMLSGGERVLVSIALLFALSQVNPPPFLVLDETDAALDEANSRKYSDMVENLAKHSQLILITHNRETMSRADVIYGVTMGSDGISKLLSIKFDEATAFAK